jgi:hypothetical protein
MKEENTIGYNVTVANEGSIALQMKEENTIGYNVTVAISGDVSSFFFFFYSYVHTMFGSFLPPSPHPLLYPPTPSLFPPPPRYQAETVLPLSLILLKRQYTQ